MKKITCIQNYVIDKLIEDEKLSTNGLLDIELPIPYTDMPKLVLDKLKNM